MKVKAEACSLRCNTGNEVSGLKRAVAADTSRAAVEVKTDMTGIKNLKRALLLTCLLLTGNVYFTPVKEEA